MSHKTQPTISLHEDLVALDGMLNPTLAEDDFCILADRADEPCACDKGQRANGGRKPNGEVDVCVPCMARGALNLVHDVATRE